jgi:hypothetical protein
MIGHEYHARAQLERASARVETILPMSFMSVLFSLFFACCSFFESEDSSQVRLSVQGNTGVLRRVISVSIGAPGWSRSLTGNDFGTPESPIYSQTFDTPTSGDLRISVTLRDSLGGHVNSGTVAVDIRPDWIWQLDIVLDNHNPFNGCFGCIGYKAFGVDSVYQASPGDSLYIVWGGNSIKHPVIY